MAIADTLNFSPTTPAPPSGQQLIVPQNDGGSPVANESFYDPVMVGDTGSGGKAGNVPAPAAGDAAANKFLKADGTFAALPKQVLGSVALAPSAPGNFTVAHGFGSTPSAAVIMLTASGAIWFQSPTSIDATNLYLVASSGAVTGKAVCFA